MSNPYRILVAIDLKPGTDFLLAEAQRYAKAFDAIVNIVHVADPDPDFVGYIKDTQQTKTGPHEVTRDYDQSLRNNRAKQFRSEHQEVDAIAETMRAAGIRVDQALTVQGPPLEMIMGEARKLGADLLILGSHQHGALYRLWYGDVAVDVAKQAPCALLVVPIAPDTCAQFTAALGYSEPDLRREVARSALEGYAQIIILAPDETATAKGPEAVKG